MNKYEQDYIENKKEVLTCMNKAESFYEKILAGGFGSVFPEEKKNYQEKLNALKCQYENLEKGEFTIVLVGEFSAGKSTFLNALMGEKILPSFTSETTATVNFLKHKNKSENGESGCVYYNDGTKKIIDYADINTISKYVSTESSEDVAKNIKHLDLYLDSKFLENNVTLVDSPGLNGVADGHREITEEQIERSSASIFLFNANQPGSNSDFEFLRNLQKKVNSIICVLNQIDCIKESEGQTVETVVAKLKENYKKMIPEAKTIPEIIPVAAYPALIARGTAKMDYNGKTEFNNEEKKHFEEISRLKAFEERLWRYLTQGEKAKQQLLSPVKQLEAQLINIRDDLYAEKDVLDGKFGAEELEEQQLELKKQKENLNERINERKSDIKKEMKIHMDELLERIDSESEELKISIKREIEDWKDIEDIEQVNIQDKVQKKLNRISDDAIDGFQDDINNMAVEYANIETESINNILAGNDFSFVLQGDIQMQDVILNYDNYEEKIEKIKEEIDKLDKEEEDVTNNIMNMMAKKIKREELKRELENKKKIRDNYEENTYIPDIEYKIVNKREERPRGGFFGKLKDWTLGVEYEIVEEEVIDRRLHDEYVKARDTKIQKYESEIKELNRQIMDIPEIDTMLLDTKRKRIEEKRIEMEIEKKNMREDFKKKAKSQIERAIKNQKSLVVDFIDENVRKFKKEFRKQSRLIQETMLENVIDMVESGVKGKLDNLENELRFLQNKIEDAATDRINRLNEISMATEEIQTLLGEILDLELVLDAVEEDKIQQIEL